ncbi:hypothetical protein ACWIYZ_08985 [Ursidibacter arcticus]
MKKILSILSLSFILSGCFDEPKKEMTSTTPAEKSEQTVDSTEKVATSVENVVEKNQTTEMASAKDEKTAAVALNDENKASVDMTKSENKTSTEMAKSEDKTSTDIAKSGNSATAKKSEDSENSKKVAITENATRNKNVEKEKNVASQKALASTQDSKKAEKHIQRKISNSDTLSNTPLPKAEARKVTINTNVIEQQDSGLSDEEKRVGYQRTLSDTEINYLKSQCRYAFMSEKEVFQYNCAAKKVIIK